MEKTQRTILEKPDVENHHRGKEPHVKGKVTEWHKLVPIFLQQNETNSTFFTPICLSR